MWPDYIVHPIKSMSPERPLSVSQRCVNYAAAN